MNNLVRRKERKLTQARLKELLSYDPETGIFIWSLCRAGVKKGAVAGSYADGYIKIFVDGNRFPSHRLAWLYVKGKFPDGEIDHINGVRDDNRISNLRDVTLQQNQQNTKLSKNNTSGFNGVIWVGRVKKWRVEIGVNRKNIYLGYYSCIGEAILKRKDANIKYGFHENHGMR